jgi:hypothetical protein
MPFLLSLLASSHDVQFRLSPLWVTVISKFFYREYNKAAQMSDLKFIMLMIDESVHLASLNACSLKDTCF